MRINSVLVAIILVTASAISSIRLATADSGIPQTNTFSVTWTSTDCLSCHRVDQAVFSHPINVSPSMAMPSGLPLTYGQVNCTTCHLNTSNDHAASRERGDNMLRPGANDCASCHEASSESNVRVKHGILAGKAHYGWAESSLSFGFPVESSVTTFNDASSGSSAQCLSCHDGSGAKSIGHSHPVDVPYRRTKTGRGISTLTPEANLDKRLRLYGGEVTCQTCHSPFSDQPKFLVMPNIDSSLCASCHVMN